MSQFGQENIMLSSLDSLRLSKGVGKVPVANNDNKENDTGSIVTSWNILAEEVSFPVAVLEFEKFTYNLNWMERFLSTFPKKMMLAPHGKTTMMPFLFKQVCELPTTWGLTLATATQVKVAHAWGIKKIIMANQLVGRRNMEIIIEIMKEDDSFEFMCLIDSPRNVEQLGQYFSERKQSLKVLLEYGPGKGGRTGVRTIEDEGKVLDALKQWKDTLKLVGVEFFEGVLSEEKDISNFIDFVTGRMKVLQSANTFHQSPITITGSGSSWFDVVARKLSKLAEEEDNIRIILRPGCFMIHDISLYNNISQRIKESDIMGPSDPGLKPCLKILAYVQSIPEKDLVILNFGKRDTATDCGFPLPCLHFRPGGSSMVKSKENWEIFKMMDQHTFMKIQEGDDIQVGDIITFDIAHPCTTFQTWRNILIVDNLDHDLKIKGIYPTFF